MCYWLLVTHYFCKNSWPTSEEPEWTIQTLLQGMRYIFYDPIFFSLHLRSTTGSRGQQFCSSTSSGGPSDGLAVTGWSRGVWAMTRLRLWWKVGALLSGYYDDETDRASAPITGCDRSPFYHTRSARVRRQRRRCASSVVRLNKLSFLCPCTSPGGRTGGGEAVAGWCDRWARDTMRITMNLLLERDLGIFLSRYDSDHSNVDGRCWSQKLLPLPRTYALIA